MPSGHACPGDSGGGVFRVTDKALVGMVSSVVDPHDLCHQGLGGVLDYAVTSVLDVTLYAGWIAEVSQGINAQNDPDCLTGQDHTCAREGVANVPSCGYLAAQVFGWKILNVAPASAYSLMSLPNGFAPPLTPDMIATQKTFPSLVNERQLASWHMQHGWRLHCEQTSISVLEGAPGWVRLDGYQSSGAFPGSSPALRGGTWDCEACLMWRGDN
ncbi:MAG: hypothetical protein H6714_08515 [Myxococcales bacterium]|nr:hypothetical protein [Myxococcales bacterium]